MTGNRAETPGTDPMQATFLAIVGRLERALRVYRYALIALAVVAAALVAGGVGLYETQQGACHAGNEFRAGDAANWDNFLDIALGPHPTPGNVKTAGLIRASIHKRDAPRACSSILPWG